MVTSCNLKRGDLSGCPTSTPVRPRDMEIIGSGHVQLYSLDIFPTCPRRALGSAARGR